MIDHKPESNGYYVLEQLHLKPENPAEIIKGWVDSYCNMPDFVPFLEDDALCNELCEYLRFDEERCTRLRTVLEIIRKTPPLKAYVWHLHYRLVTPSFSTGCHPSGFYGYPMPEYHLKENANYTFLAAILGAVLIARENYRASQVPEEIIRDTLSCALGSLNKDPRYKTGGGGLGPAGYGWFRLYLAGRLLQLGRFNFKLMETTPFGVVLQHKKDRRKVFLFEAGKKCNAKGYLFREKGLYDLPYADPYAEGAFSTTLEITDQGWSGHPVDPRGFILPEKKFFSRDEWDVILQDGDSMIDMHIPGGGGMTPELCKESFRMAKEYFSKRYPGKFKDVIICHSWIFNNQFEEKMPDGNLAKQMRECYLFPHNSCGQDGIYFLFGRYLKTPEDFANAPRDTRLRSIMLDLAQSPEQLRCSGMLYFLEDLDHYGESVYRNTFRV